MSDIFSSYVGHTPDMSDVKLARQTCTFLTFLNKVRKKKLSMEEPNDSNSSSKRRLIRQPCRHAGQLGVNDRRKKKLEKTPDICPAWMSGVKKKKLLKNVGHVRCI